VSRTLMERPTFNKEQIVSATDAAKYFGKYRKKAKEIPQFISDNNKIDSVLIDYDLYEKMYIRLMELEEYKWEQEILRRIQDSKENPQNSRSLREVLGEKEYQEFLAMDANDISDEDLFEDD